MDAETRDGPPRALLIAAIVVAAGAIIARPRRRRAAAVPAGTTSRCDRVSARTEGRQRRMPRARSTHSRTSWVTTAAHPRPQPAPPGAAAWTADGEPVIMRCGLDRPAEFVVGSPIQVVDAVQWFELADQGRSTWFAVDRPVYIALTLPQGSGPTPIQEISDVIAKSLPAKPIDPAPPR